MNRNATNRWKALMLRETDIRVRDADPWSGTEEHFFASTELVARDLGDAIEADDEPAFDALMTFSDLACDLGYADISGASMSLKRSLRKLRFLLDADQNDVTIAWLLAMKEYVAMLSETGELTYDEACFLENNPEALGESEEFRVRFGQVINAMIRGNDEPWLSVRKNPAVRD